MKKWLLICLLLFPRILNAQIITTIAGGGTGGDGNPATAASIYDPGGMAIDKYGNLYFGETLGNRIRKIDTLGIITTIAGTGIAGYGGDGDLATNAMLREAGSPILDSLGNIFIADAANNRIRKIDVNTGIISTIIGNSTAGFGGDNDIASAATLNAPSAICFDRFGDLYISDANNFRVRKVNITGIITTVAGNGLPGNGGDGGQATVARCEPDQSICVDFSGNLYIADYTTYVIRKVNTTGIITTIAGDTSSYLYNGDEIPATNATLVPAYIAINHAGILYI